MLQVGLAHNLPLTDKPPQIIPEDTSHGRLLVGAAPKIIMLAHVETMKITMPAHVETITTRSAVAIGAGVTRQGLARPPHSAKY